MQGIPAADCVALAGAVMSMRHQESLVAPVAMQCCSQEDSWLSETITRSTAGSFEGVLPHASGV